MVYSEEEIQRQIRLGEDSGWEFKQIEFRGERPVGPTRDRLADEITAFANGRGGVLLCGVTDAGEVQDMTREQLTALDAVIGEVSSDRIKPPVRAQIYHREISAGKRVLLAEIPKGDALHKSSGKAFVRVGGSTREMTGDEELRLAQKRSQARYLWFDKQPLPNTGFESLDESLWKPMLSARAATPPEVGLEKQALLADDDDGILRATVAGVLLCAQSPDRWLPGAVIMATCYRGLDRASRQVDAKEITGPLGQQIADAMAFVIRNMRVSARKTPARTDQPQYSGQALFEALVNAVVHRDYSIRGSRIRLSMFENRVEIQSPGALPNNLTIDSMGERQATRNEALASALGRMPVGETRGSEDRQYFMERRGDGVPIIKRETERLSGKPPEYRLIDESEVQLTIPAAAWEESEAQAKITAWADGAPAPGVEILVLFPNKTWKQAATDSEGEAAFDLYTTHHPLTVFAAAPGYAAHVTREWLPSENALALDLKNLSDGGSVLFPEATGQLPGLKGRLNPILDTHERTYLYAANISINEGRQQPVSFRFGEELRLTDADGNERWIRIIEIVGRSVLLEYRLSSQSA